MTILEFFLSQIDDWPSNIIRYLFIDTPNEKIVRELSAFFYGNWIPLSDACALYSVCNKSDYTPLTSLLHHYATSGIQAYYTTWDDLPYVRNIGPHYYDLNVKKYLCLHGMELMEPEEFLPGLIPTLGIENTGCPLHIRTIISSLLASERA